MSTPATAQPVNIEIQNKVHAALKASPRAMTSMLAAQLGLPEAEVVRHLPDNHSTALDAARCEELIRSFEGLGAVHVIVNSGTVVLEAVGEFGGFSTTGPFLNVQTKSLDMHIKYTEFASIFAVVKPSHMDGVPTYSIQFFNKAGVAGFKVFLTFGGTTPNPERQAAFENYKSKFARAGAA